MSALIKRYTDGTDRHRGHVRSALQSGHRACLELHEQFDLEVQRAGSLEACEIIVREPISDLEGRPRLGLKQED